MRIFGKSDGGAVLTKVREDDIPENGVYVVPNFITHIDEHTFIGLKKLKEVQMPDSVLTIGFGAFCDCIYLEKITFSKNLKRINDFAFKGCSSLKSIEIPSKLKILPKVCFGACKNLEEVKICEGLEEVSKFAFRDCTSLKSICFPNSTKEIAEYVFEGCKNLKTVSVQETTHIFSTALSDCPTAHIIRRPQKEMSL